MCELEDRWRLFLKLLSSSHTAYSICLKRQGEKKEFFRKGKRSFPWMENHPTSTRLGVSTAEVDLGMDPGGTEANGSISVLKGAGQSPWGCHHQWQHQAFHNKGVSMSACIKQNHFEVEVMGGGPGSLGSFRIYLPRSCLQPLSQPAQTLSLAV